MNFVDIFKPTLISRQIQGYMTDEDMMLIHPSIWLLHIWCPCYSTPVCSPSNLITAHMGGYNL